MISHFFPIVNTASADRALSLLYLISQNRQCAGSILRPDHSYNMGRAQVDSCYKICICHASLSFSTNNLVLIF